MFTNNKFAKMDSIANLINTILETDTKAKMEELKGGQHKIDKNKNNKIDAQDFAILRGQKRGMKEESEQVDEAQSHQAKTTMKHITNPTAGEKKAAKDIKPGVAGYRDRIAMLKSAEARGALKKEESEQVDEARVKGKGYDNPENERKAPEGHVSMTSLMPGHDERAAKFLARQAKGTLVKGKAQSAPQKEEVEQLDELSKTTLSNYKRKASVQMVGAKDDLDNLKHSPDKGDRALARKSGETYVKRSLGVAQADRKLRYGKYTREEVEITEMDKSQPSSSRGAEGHPVGKVSKPISYDKAKKDAYGALKTSLNKKYQKVKEEAEQIDELKISTLARYATKANQALIGGDRSKEDKRIKGIKTAQYKILKQRANKIKEEVEQIDELKHDTLSKYQKAASKSVAYGGVDYKKDPNKFMKRLKGYMTAHDKINKKLAIKEEEQVDERTLSAPETAEKERMVKGMKKGLEGFKQRYGERAKEVMYATATARAKEKK